MRRVEKRSYKYHLSFIFILLFETLIAIVVFIAGVKFILSKNNAGDIVSGILGISFITDIDNQGNTLIISHTPIITNFK